MRGFGRNASGVKVGRSGGKVGFLGAAPVAQQATDSKVAITYTANDPSITTDGAITVADGSTPTVAELLEFCEELNDKIETLQGVIQAFGLQA